MREGSVMKRMGRERDWWLSREKDIFFERWMIQQKNG
jgi:hypothetical protein